MQTDRRGNASPHRRPGADPSRTASGRRLRRWGGGGSVGRAALLGGLLLAAAAAGQTVPGDRIVNTARATFGAGENGSLLALSNTVTLTVTAPATPASLALLRVTSEPLRSALVPVAETWYSASGLPAGPFLPLPPPVTVGGTALDLTQPLPLAAETRFHQGEPLFLSLEDPDQNLDAAVADRLLVEVECAGLGDRELLRLTETGPATGRFAGYLQTAAGAAAQAKDGVLAVCDGAVVGVRYVDPDDAADLTRAEALIDPLGTVFDARTGLALDGAVVTLLEAVSGLPARVLGDDGVSLFPASVPAGGSVTDASGRRYDFPPGGYRFPYVAPGLYRLAVAPPPDYRAPSRRSLADIQALPTGPFELLTEGSFGGDFAVADGPPLVVDLPLDPLDASLYLSKAADRSSVSPGDFLEYAVRLENRSEEDAEALALTDVLPAGFRYRAGSTRLDGAAADDPVVAADGRTLRFVALALPAGGRLEVRYVAEVLSHARPGRAVNTATAAWAQIPSNPARAAVTVVPDLFDGRCTVLGRVAVAACGADTAEAGRGVPGVRIVLEDGTFAVTDEQGRYHLAGLRPGSHVVQLDPATLPPRLAAGDCAAADGARHPHARLIDLQGGTLWQEDFAVRLVPRGRGRVDLDLTATLAGDRLGCRVRLAAGGTVLRDPELTVTLPDSVRYLPGTSRLDDRPLPDPVLGPGTLTYTLPTAVGDWQRTLTLAAVVDPALSGGVLTTGALLSFTGPESGRRRSEPVRATVPHRRRTRRVAGPELVLNPHFRSLSADLEPADRRALDELALRLGDLQVVAVQVVGHSDDQPIRPGAHPLYRDNFRLSEARARSVGDYLARRLDLPPSRLAVSGRGDREPIADNASAAGRAINRRVTVQIFSEEVLSELSTDPVSDRAAVSSGVPGLRPGEAAAAAADPEPAVPALAPPSFDTAWLDTVPAGRALVWPVAEYLPAVPSLLVAVQHLPGDRVVVALNGAAVGPLDFAGTETNAWRGVAVSLWRGVDLRVGDNELLVRLLDADGRRAAEIRRSVHFSGPPVRAVVLPERSRLIADGRSRPEIAVRLTDRDGYPVREGVVGDFAIAAPYLPADQQEEAARRSLTGLAAPRPTYVVGPGGLARIRLEPTAVSGEAVLRLTLTDREEELRTWLQPEPRDWILAGLAEGGLGFRTGAGPTRDGRLALYGKGRLKGSWLATLGYDSDRPGGRDADGLFGTVDLDAYYTVYGDAGVQGHDAPSTAPLYLKLERRRFYALYGDFATGLTTTGLARYDRRLTGLKSGRHGEQVGWTVFASRPDHGYVRDEIRGDGTSGLYRLSRSDVVLHSEQVILQTRDRYRSEIVLSERPLARLTDYELDDGAGTLFFKEPIPAQDAQFNPVWIVVEYEAWGGEAIDTHAGGRASWRPGAGGLELGATVVHEGGAAGGDLQGLDLRWDLDERTRLRAERAWSDSEADGDRAAWSASLARLSGPVQGRLYYQERQQGFGLGQLNRSESGTRKLGLDLSGRLGERLRADAVAYRQEGLSNGTRREVAEAKLNWAGRRLSANLGLRGSEDRLTDGTRRSTGQLLAGSALQLWRNRLRLRAARDQGLAGDGGSAFADRTTLGAEGEIGRDQTLFVNREWSGAGSLATRSTRVGLRSVPWQGAEASSSVGEEWTESGRRVFSVMGLKQTWRLNEAWSLDAGLDHGAAAGPDSTVADAAAVPATVGPTGDYTAMSLGAAWRGRNWLWNQRLELRQSPVQDKWGLSGGLFVEPSRAVGLLASLRLLGTRGGADGFQRMTEAGLGLAWRPRRQAWVLLDRLQVKTEDRLDSRFALSSWRIVNNLNLTRGRGGRGQLALFYGSKFVRETLGGRRYEGFSDHLGLEVRRRFARRWDWGLRGSARHGWSAGTVDWSAGVSVGVRFLEDLWLSLGCNLTGYEDRDFAADNATAAGIHLRLRARFNQDSTREMLR